MGSYDGAEVCELIGTYMLSQVNQIIDNSDVDLYRDDGLWCYEKCWKARDRKKEEESYSGIQELRVEYNHQSQCRLCSI